MQLKLLPFRIHMLCNLRSREALSRKKRTHTKISRGVQSMEKSVDRLISIVKNSLIGTDGIDQSMITEMPFIDSYRLKSRTRL